jgi:hypothetical protein
MFRVKKSEKPKKKSEKVENVEKICKKLIGGEKTVKA